MKVLVLNAGSSSVKYQLIDMQNQTVIAKGIAEKIGLGNSFLKHKANGEQTIINQNFSDHEQAIEKILTTLTDSKLGVIKSLQEINAIGHRVLHGGELYKDSVIITDKVMKDLKTLVPLGPLHMPANIKGIESVRKLVKVPNVAVFDTAFHAKMPKKAYMYGLPYQAYKEWGIRKYGFHGTSHKYVSQRVAAVMGKDIKDLKIVTIHLGNGSSMAAISGGISVDTTMGLTPLDGLVMGTRCGAIDPSCLEFINSKTGWDVKEITNYLNKKSGMLGLNGKTSDSRENDQMIAEGDERAKLFVEILAYQIIKYIGSYYAIMGGVDAIAFTGGIGENQENIRQWTMEALGCFGIKFNNDLNWHLERDTERELSLPDSKIKIFRIPTNEELSIAQDTVRLTTK